MLIITKYCFLFFISISFENMCDYDLHMFVKVLKSIELNLHGRMFFCLCIKWIEYSSNTMLK